MSSDALAELLALLLHQLVGQDGIGNLDHVARREGVPGHLLAHGDDLLDHQRGARQRFQHRVLAALDAARDFHLALAREQRDRAHLPQVHADRVVDLLADAGGQIQIDELFALFELLLEVLGLFQDFDAGRVQAGQHVFQVGAAGQIAGQNFADLVVQDVALLLAHLYEPVQPLEFIFKRH